MRNCGDILICSHYDGTLSYGGICEENVNAIKEFTACGGRFTLSTGRRGEEVANGGLLPFELNAPMVGLCGAQIYDTNNAVALEQNYLDSSWTELINELCDKVEYSEKFEIVGEKGSYRFDVCDKDEQKRILSLAGSDDIYKIVAFNSFGGDSWLPPKVEDICLGRFGLTSNGQSSYEILPFGIDKGYGARKVKDLVGAKTLVCVGDYIGDVPMLLAADIAYAVENARPELKAVAHRVTVHAKDGAIAKIIHELTSVIQK